MYNKESVILFLKDHLKESRFEHSLRVMEYSIKLAKIHGVDEYKAEIAGLLHDCGKWISKEDMIRRLEKSKIRLEDELAVDFNLVHALLGEVIAREEFGIYDNDVLDAIKFHITGRSNMSDLEKVVFLADKLEPMRDYPRVDEFREYAKTNMDKAILEVMNDTIKLLIDKREYISHDTIDARNDLLIKENEWRTH